MIDIHSTFLVDRLAVGWPRTQPGPVHDFVQRWAAALCTEADLAKLGENTTEFRLSLSDVRLPTMHEAPCIIVTGKTNSTPRRRRFWNPFNSTNHLPFVTPLSEAANAAATRMLSSRQRLILSLSHIKLIFWAALARFELRQLLIQQLPQSSLVLCNLLVPIGVATFLGRQNELSRLHDEDFASFAITESGQVGKTSLVLRHCLPFFAQEKNFVKNALEEARQAFRTVSPTARLTSAVGNMR